MHVQNPTGETNFPITRGQWDAAVARCPGLGAMDVSFADDDAGFADGMRDAAVLITWNREVVRRLPRGVLPGAAPGLRVIALTSAGMDALQPFDWLPPGVTVLNNSGTHARKAGEFGIMAILMLETRFPAIAANGAKGLWEPIYSSTLEGRTVVIVGIGSLGGAVAKRARAFGMRVIGVRRGSAPDPDCDETVPFTALDSVLPRAGFLVMTCPLTPETRGILSRERVALLPRGAKVINMARGAVWDQDAVCDALDAGALDGGITDVAVPEPLPPDSRVWRTRNLMVTPHICCDDRERYNDNTLDIVFANLRARARGEAMPNAVDTAVGY